MSVFGIVFISLFFCYIQIAIYLGEIGVEQNVIGTFLIEKVKVLLKIWALTTNGKDFFLDERKRHLKVKLMSCGRRYPASV